jgi:hypothetical protein
LDSPLGSPPGRGGGGSYRCRFITIDSGRDGKTRRQGDKEKFFNEIMGFSPPARLNPESKKPTPVSGGGLGKGGVGFWIRNFHSYKIKEALPGSDRRKPAKLVSKSRLRKS